MRLFFLYLRIMKKTLLILFIASVFLSCKKNSNYKINKNHKKEVGYSSNDLLSNNDYRKLTVEIQYMAGYKPTETTLSNLTSFLSNRLNKSDGIYLVEKQIPAQNKGTYSINDIENIEKEYRSEFTHKKEIATYFLFLDGEFSGNSGNGKVLGVAYFNTSMAIFEETIHDLSGGFGEPSQTKLETTVVNHEFGHVLGLVNTGASMQINHQDVAHGSHCDNDNCLMNWIAETGGVVGNLIGSSPIPQLDQSCMNDLRANGGK
jgi:hypothetical protein